jgi:hypothetical protein
MMMKLRWWWQKDRKLKPEETAKQRERRPKDLVIDCQLMHPRLACRPVRTLRVFKGGKR